MEEYSRRFVQEARAAAQVRHPNIVAVLDFGFDAERGVFYLVQELLLGRDLKRLIREQGLMAPRAAIELLLPVMRALAYAHSRGIVHRDLKPDNIFLAETPEGEAPKLIDFGIAKVTNDQGQSVQHTHSAVVMGTPHYMSPEQARGDRTVDHRTDVWSLGVVLYHLITRRFPYEGPTGNVIVAGIITREPTPIETYAPGLSPDITALVSGAITPAVERRFQTMDAFWRAARACLCPHDSEPPRFERTQSTPGATTATQAPAGGDTDRPRVTTVPPARRNRWKGAAALSLALVLAASIGGAALLRAGRSTPSVRSRTQGVAPAPSAPHAPVTTDEHTDVTPPTRPATTTATLALSPSAADARPDAGALTARRRTRNNPNPARRDSPAPATAQVVAPGPVSHTPDLVY